MWAFKQWRGAVMIRESVNQANPGVLSMLISRHRCFSIPLIFLLVHPWTTTHGHFLQMGGFRVKMSENEFNGLHCKVYRIYANGDFKLYEGSEKPIYTAHTGRLFEGVLTEGCLKALLCKGLISFPAITREEINDKSKGDALSKGIAFVQLTWFIAQIIARHVRGLEITEIEITTVALAGLSVAMYIFWWNKPLDVRCPIIVRTKGAEEFSAAGLKKRDIRWNFDQSEFSLFAYLQNSFIGFALRTAGNMVHIFPYICRVVAQPSSLFCCENSQDGRPRSDSESTYGTVSLARMLKWLYISCACHTHRAIKNRRYWRV